MNIGTVSENIANFVVDLEWDDIPVEAKEYAKLLFTDAIGVGLTCHRANHVKALREAVTDMKGASESTLWGTRRKVPACFAALVNASMVHGVDFDDTHVAAVVHPSSCVVPASLAVGETVGASGKEVLVAALAGYEVVIRLGLAAAGDFHDKGYHATGVLGPFAAACVTAKILGLDQQALVNAMGICGSQAAGLQQFLQDGSWVKKLHPGWASHAAILSVNMAAKGFTGPPEVFEGEFGVWRTHLGIVNRLSAVFDDLGETWRTSEISVKMYPCCHFTHSFIDCVLRLRDYYHLKQDDIERVECLVSKRVASIVCEPASVKKRPQTDYAARFSLPYVVAVALLKGKVGPPEFDERSLEDPDVRRIADTVEHVIDPRAENPGHFPGWVRVFLKDGTMLEHVQRYERGSKENPISTAEILEKAKTNLSLTVPMAQARELIKNIGDLENVESVSNLTYLMAPDENL